MSEVGTLRKRLLAENEKRRQIQNKFKKQGALIASFHETTLGLLNHRKIDELLEAILKRASELMDTANGFIYLANDNRDTLEMKIGLGLYADSRINFIKKGEALGGEIWETGKPLTIDNYAAWPRRVRDPKWDCLRAVIGAPLKSHDKVAGVIGLSGTNPSRKFEREEVLLLGRFADIASIALENARLFNALENELKEHRRTEAELHLSTERLNAVFNNARDYIYIKNDKLSFIDMNPAMINALGINGADKLHELENEIYRFPLAQRLSVSERNVMGGGTVEEEFETVIMGKHAIIHNIMVPLKNSNEKIIGIFGIARDITDKRSSEMKISAAKEAVARAERMASLGVMAAVMSHEINQPLNSIKVTSSGIIYLHKNEIDQDLEGVIEDVRNISKQADHIGEIIRHVRSFIHEKNDSKSMELQMCDLAESIDMSLRLVGNQLSVLRINVNQFIEPGLPNVCANKTGLVEIVVNLLINAMENLDSMDNPNKIISVKLYSQDNNVVLEIADNGPGVPTEIVNRIFEPFFTTKKKGESMGLGLSIIKSIVETCGGHISLIENSASGKIFQVKLPTAQIKTEMKKNEYFNC